MDPTFESSAATSNQSSVGPSHSKNHPSFVFSGSPTITSEKLNGKNYMDWQTAVEIWFLGQGLDDHLTKKAVDINTADQDQWKKADYQLVSLLWQSIDPKLLVHFRTYKTCYDIWKKARNVYSNDVQRLYDVVHKLATLQMTENDLPTYLTKSQSTIDEVKLLMTGDNMENKLDNMCMVFVLHGLYKDLESVRNQILTNPSIPIVENLMDRLLRVPPSETMIGSSSGSESSAFFSNTTNRGGRGHGRSGRGGRGSGNRPHCSYCNRMGHTRDKCYFLVGFPERSTRRIP